MRIFVSYARVDKPYCIRIIETMHAHDVWYDQRLYAGQDWWKEILRRLDWCEVFIYLLSPDSIASLYCRRELEIARRLKRHIIPVLINRDTVLPDKMKGWQYVDLSENLTVENVTKLLNSILHAERQKGTIATDNSRAGASGNSPMSDSNPVELVSNAVRALEKGDYDNAILLLKQAQASGYRSRFVRLDKLLRIAETAVAERTQSREVEREYQHIVALFAFESTRKLACEALAEFAAEFGNYDPQGLHRLCDSGAPVKAISKDKNLPAGLATNLPAIGSQSVAQVQNLDGQTAALPSGFSSQVVKPPTANDRKQTVRALRTIDARRVAAAPMAEEILPMLQWCDIPYGTVTISSMVGTDEDFGEMTVNVDNFVMSMYPVTNAQFAIFAKAEDGYKNPRWWSFSQHATSWFKQGQGVAESRFSGDARPRENVNWYEAMAFANWLSGLLKMKVTLPTIAQWQRAAKGDDDRYFPWGDDYYEEHCNTLESGLKMTTPVNRFQKGVSPYGVYDMAGNLWEWTMNTASASEEGRDFRRAVAGGSFVSPCDRAQTSFRYYLDPRVRYSSIGIRLVGLTS